MITYELSATTKLVAKVSEGEMRSHQSLFHLIRCAVSPAWDKQVLSLPILSGGHGTGQFCDARAYMGGAKLA